MKNIFAFLFVFSLFLLSAGRQMQAQTEEIIWTKRTLKDLGIKGEEECELLYIVCNPDDVFPNIGDWATYPTEAPFLDDAFYASRFNMLDENIDDYCRRKKSYDAMQAAFLGDSIEHKTNMLIHDYDLIINDLSLPVANKTSALLLKGEAYERLEKLDTAVITYNNLLTCYPNSLDTLYAQWRNNQLMLSHRIQLTGICSIPLWLSIQIEYCMI
jgi:hypothetical protein